MNWFRKLFGDQPQPGGQTQPANGLSAEQQRALCLSAQKLEYIALGAKQVSLPGEGQQFDVSPQAARWALPHAERILDAQTLFKNGDVRGAINIFRSLPQAAIIQMNIGVCYATIGEKQEALAWLKKSSEAMPASHQAMLKENLRRLQAPEAPPAARSDMTTPPTHATCMTCRKPIPFAQKDAPWGSAIICPHCHAPRLEYNSENPLPTSPSHAKIHFGLEGRGLDHPRCPFCSRINYAVVFPAKGMTLAWHSVSAPENPAGFRFKVQCVNCARDFFVEWDENPF